MLARPPDTSYPNRRHQAVSNHASVTLTNAWSHLLVGEPIEHLSARVVVITGGNAAFNLAKLDLAK